MTPQNSEVPYIRKSATSWKLAQPFPGQLEATLLALDWLLNTIWIKTLQSV